MYRPGYLQGVVKLTSIDAFVTLENIRLDPIDVLQQIIDVTNNTINRIVHVQLMAENYAFTEQQRFSRQVLKES